MQRFFSFITLVLSCYLVLRSSSSHAQCQAILPFTENSMEHISDVYQFTFLHKQPQNKLDSLVQQLINPHLVIDSNYFDWNYNAPQIRSVLDLVQYRKLMDDIGRLKSKEAFVLLSMPYMIPFKVQDDLSPFNTMCYHIQYYGGGNALNKYFLNDEVSVQLNYTDFHNAVILKTKALRNKYFKDVTYCKKLEGDAWRMYEMQQTNPAPYDSVYINILSKYFTQNRLIKNLGMNTVYALDSVMIDVLQHPLTVDAMWDDCLPRLNTDNAITNYMLGIIVHVGTDINGQKKYIQRVYEVENDPRRGQRILQIFWDLDFVSHTRRLCNGKE
jgi:hypothetical protein